MSGLIKYASKAFGDFFDGLFGGVLDWLSGFVTRFFNGLKQVVEAILSIFDFIPALLKFMDMLLKSVFWFFPDVVFNILYLGIALVFIFLICRLIFKK